MPKWHQQKLKMDTEGAAALGHHGAALAGGGDGERVRWLSASIRNVLITNRCHCSRAPCFLCPKCVPGTMSVTLYKHAHLSQKIASCSRDPSGLLLQAAVGTASACWPALRGYTQGHEEALSMWGADILS